MLPPSLHAPHARSGAGPVGTPCPLRRLLGLVLLLGTVGAAAPAPGSAQEPQRRWSAGVGLGLGVDLRGGDQEGSDLGLATHAHAVWHRGSSPGIGLSWDGAWFQGPFTRERRLLLAAVVQVDLGSTPLHLRAGPGVGMVTVVEVDLPGGLPGGGLVTIGEQGGWGLTTGLGGRIGLGAGVLEPAASLLWQRADRPSGGTLQTVTLTLGARLALSG